MVLELVVRERNCLRVGSKYTYIHTYIYIYIYIYCSHLQMLPPPKIILWRLSGGCGGAGPPIN